MPNLRLGRGHRATHVEAATPKALAVANQLPRHRDQRLVDLQVQRSIFVLHSSGDLGRHQQRCELLTDAPLFEGDDTIVTLDQVVSAEIPPITEVCPDVPAEVSAIVTKALERKASDRYQTAGQMGGYKVQGRDLESARKLVQMAKGLEDAGAFSIVLECIPASLANVITDHVSIPTIGIGAGAGCDGQVLVTHDLLGMFEKFMPSFVKNYTQLAPQIKDAVASYAIEVKGGAYPDKEHSFSMKFEVDELLNY